MPNEVERVIGNRDPLFQRNQSLLDLLEAVILGQHGSR